MGKFFNRISYALDVLRGRATIQLAERGRASKSNPQENRYGRMSPIVEPDEKTGSFRFLQVTYTQLLRMTPDKAITKLVQANPAMARITNIFVNNVVQDYSLESEDDAAKQIIEDFFDGMGGKVKVIELLKQICYGNYAEGGSGIELVNDEQGTPNKIVYVSIWTMSADKMSNGTGDYYVYGQRNKQNKLDPVLYDESDPTDYFKVITVNKKGDKPFGNSTLTPAILPAVALSDMLTLLLEFMQGRVFPKHLYSLDVQPLIDAKWSKEDIQEALNTASDLLNSKISSADVTEDIVLATKVTTVLVGAMEAAGIDGSELIIDINERELQGISGIPQTLFGSKRTAAALNSDENRIAWQGWSITKESARIPIKTPIDDFLTLILRANGNASTVTIELIDNDYEQYRIEAEAFLTAMKGYTLLNKLGIYTQQELRTISRTKHFDLSIFDDELPSELANSQPTEPQPIEPTEDPEDGENNP